MFFSVYIKNKFKYNQPTSLVDFFGYTVGKELLGPQVGVVIMP